MLLAPWPVSGSSTSPHPAGAAFLAIDVKPGPPKYNSPDEPLTVEQAKGLYKNSAYARFSDNQIGTLAPGKLADLAVLMQDIFSAAPEEIAKRPSR
jgi:predicted amidohydrolase YtcJ